MTRRDTRTRRTLHRRNRHAARSQTVAASALAGGCLAVVALWKVASGTAPTEAATR